MVSRKAGQIVLSVSGVGYLVNVTPDVYQQSFSKSSFSLHISHIIREDSQTLFGFLTESELDAFNMLCSVNGVGPKSAMSVLAHLGVEGVSKAVTTEDDSMFKAVTGVGPKTAKLIILTLTGRLKLGEDSGSPASGNSASVVSALVGLGYQEKMARAAVDAVDKAEPGLDESDLLKKSLAAMSTSRK